MLGGPFYYIERGMGAKWKPLALLFAFLGGVATAGGIGTATQINGICDTVKNLVDPDSKYMLSLGSLEYSWCVVVVSIVLSIVLIIILAGGLKRVSQFAEVVVPIMAVIYIGYCIAILVFNVGSIPKAFYNVFVGAFNPSAITGGAIGSFFVVMQTGIARSVFSGELCLGSAPIAAAAAKTNDPVKQGLITMTSNFVVFLICTCTGIAIVATDSWNVGLNGVSVTTRAFQMGLPFVPKTLVNLIMMLCLAFFAFTTIVGWEYYGERCWEYLFNGSKRACIFYRVLYILICFIGAYLSVSTIWTISNILCGLMAFPNMIALLMLIKDVAHDTKKYFTSDKPVEPVSVSSDEAN